jgi:hypothetical protein
MIIEIVVVILSVIGLLWVGIFIGREFGTLEKFIVWYIKHISGQDQVLPPYDGGYNCDCSLVDKDGNEITL